jgi:hypothetical protein
VDNDLSGKGKKAKQGKRIGFKFNVYVINLHVFKTQPEITLPVCLL